MKQGWEIKKLSAIGKAFNGNSINEKVKKDNYTGLQDGLPFIATKDVGFESKIDYENGVRIPFNEINQFKIAPSNTPLICAEGGSAGRKIGFTNQDVCFGNKLFALVTNKNIDSKYIYYYFFSSSFQQNFSAEMTGIIGGVSMNKFKNIEIPVPPLAEQQRIVAILDECFSAIDQAKANTERNLKNARELFESYLQVEFYNGDLETKTLDEVCVISSKLIDPRESNYQNLIHVGAGNIESSTGKLYDLKTAKEENLISGKFLFDESMVLYSKIRPYLKKVVNCRFKGLCSADVYPLKPLEKVITKDYLYHLLLTNEFTNYAIAGSQRAGMPKINREHLFAYEFKLPSLEEQQNVIRKLNALSAKTQELEKIYKQKLIDLDELRKTILQKAFTYELATA